MNEMVDRVAVAIGEGIQAVLAGKSQNVSVRDLARLAISATREPTDAMVRTGVDLALRTSLGGDYRWPDYIRDKHRAMIGTVLDEART